jgi:anti-sigma B factor antagonist
LSELDQRREASRIDAQGIKPPPAYAVEQHAPAEHVTVLELRGELDMAAAPVLRGRAEECGTPALVLDLAAATFVDSAMLRELLRARAELAARGVRLCLAAASEPVLRLLELTGTADLFELQPDVGSAVTRLRA